MDVLCFDRAAFEARVFVLLPRWREPLVDALGHLHGRLDIAGLHRRHDRRTALNPELLHPTVARRLTCLRPPIRDFPPLQ